MKVLDSDHCVAVLRGTLDLRSKTLPSDDLAVTAISVAELTHGAFRSERRAENLARLDILLSSLHILPFDEGAARRCGQLKAELETAGQRLADLDLQIASIALDAAAPLLTHNRRHFARISGLVIEDWLEN